MPSLVLLPVSLLIDVIIGSKGADVSMVIKKLEEIRLLFPAKSLAWAVNI